MLVGFKPERVETELAGQRYTLPGATAAVSLKNLGGEYTAVIGPDLPWEPVRLKVAAGQKTKRP